MHTLEDLKLVAVTLAVDMMELALLKNTQQIQQVFLELLMAKIVVRLPEPKQEYDISNQKQINRALTTVVEQLNSTFLETEKEEQQRFNFFLS